MNCFDITYIFYSHQHQINFEFIYHFLKKGIYGKSCFDILNAGSFKNQQIHFTSVEN